MENILEFNFLGSQRVDPDLNNQTMYKAKSVHSVQYIL